MPEPATETFAAHRSLLFTVAYEMLGSAADAEDVLQEAWLRTILPAVEEKSIPTASVLREAHPKGLANDTLTVEFPREASFHRQLAEEPKNATLLEEALYEITGRHLSLTFEVGENGGEGEEPAPERPASEEEIIELMKGTFDAHEVSDGQ